MGTPRCAEAEHLDWQVSAWASILAPHPHLGMGSEEALWRQKPVSGGNREREHLFLPVELCGIIPYIDYLFKESRLEMKGQCMELRVTIPGAAPLAV